MQWYFHLRILWEKASGQQVMPCYHGNLFGYDHWCETDLFHIVWNRPESGSHRNRTGYVSGLDGPWSDLLDPFPPGQMENLSGDR